MQSLTRKKQYKSISALILLSLIGVGFLIFAVVLIICGFLINLHDDFDASNGGNALESRVTSQHDYTQYWLGIPLLFTAALSIASAVRQHHRLLNAITLTVFHICIVLALFAVVLEGPDWVYWKNKDRFRQIWEDKSGYNCLPDITCQCNNGTSGTGKMIDSGASCSNIKRLSGLFGGVVASAVIVIFLSLAGIIVFLKSVSWRKDDNYRMYNLSENPQSYDKVVYTTSENPATTTYQEKPYANGGFVGY